MGCRALEGEQEMAEALLRGARPQRMAAGPEPGVEGVQNDWMLGMFRKSG